MAAKGRQTLRLQSWVRGRQIGGWPGLDSNDQPQLGHWWSLTEEEMQPHLTLAVSTTAAQGLAMRAVPAELYLQQAFRGRPCLVSDAGIQNIAIQGPGWCRCLHA